MDVAKVKVSEPYQTCTYTHTYCDCLWLSAVVLYLCCWDFLYAYDCMYVQLLYYLRRFVVVYKLVMFILRCWTER